jgi:hypothetical protein
VRETLKSYLYEVLKLLLINPAIPGRQCTAMAGYTDNGNLS